MRYSKFLVCAVGLPLGVLLCSCSGQVENVKQNPSLSEEEKVIDEQPIMTWPDLTGRPLPEPTTTVNYNDLPTGVVDVWLPEGEGPFPVVLMIHGGCWQKAIADRTLMNYAAEDLRKKGMAVWNIEYRGVDEDGGGYPGTFDDVAQAGNALAQYGADLNLDLNRIAGFGHSAGGHLITWYAGSKNIPVTSEVRTVREVELIGVVNSGGLADLEYSEPFTLKSCLADIKGQLTGDKTDLRPDPLIDTSSVRLLPSKVPVFSVNGEKDRIAPVELGQAYTKIAEDLGDKASFISIPGEGHVELIAPDTQAFDTQANILLEILNVE